MKCKRNASRFFLTIVIFLTWVDCFASPRVVQVFVALADNQNQGIVPVPAALGNGDDAARNLYWGSAYGVKTFFSRSHEWQLLTSQSKPKADVLERCVFKHRASDVYLIAYAYRGKQIKQTIIDFLRAAASGAAEIIGKTKGSEEIRVSPNLVVYIGHEGFMDFQLPSFPRKTDAASREAIVLACISRQYFADALRMTGAHPLLWTTGLMAPEAYTLKSALDGWILKESNDQIRERAAAAYQKYQKCGLRAARRLLVTGW